MLEDGESTAEGARLGLLREKLDGGGDRTPKYRTLRNLLAEAVTRGVWAPGARLPTETALARALSLSTGTVQKAYQMLVSEGVVIRRRGSGSFVASAAREMPEPWHCRFLADDGEGFLPVYPRVIHRRPRRASPAAARHLGAGARLGRIDRRIRIADEFSVLSRFHASEDVIVALLEMPSEVLDGANFKTLLLRKWDRPVTSISQTVVQIRLDRDVAKLIDAGPGAPGLKIEALARTFENAPVYYQELFVPDTGRRLLVESIHRA